MEKNIVTIKTEIDNIKATQQNQSQILYNEEQHHHSIKDRFRKLEHSNMNLEKENLDLQEQFLELKTHSMKYNLIFTGIPHSDGHKENTDVLHNFLNSELEISDANGIPFQSVHRLDTRPDGKERSSITRFNRYNDHERIQQAASEKLKNKPAFSVYQEYPREIYNRRKLLIPKLKELQRQKRKAKLVYDKLYVDRRPYEFTHHQGPPSHIPGQRNRVHNGQ